MNPTNRYLLKWVCVLLAIIIALEFCCQTFVSNAVQILLMGAIALVVLTILVEDKTAKK